MKSQSYSQGWPKEEDLKITQPTSKNPSQSKGLAKATSQELDKILDLWKGDILACFIPKCSYCGTKRKVVGQVTKGLHAQQDNHLPRNWGFYCQKCYDEGTKAENEAMYG